MLLFLALGRIPGAECYISVMYFSLCICSYCLFVRWRGFYGGKMSTFIFPLIGLYRNSTYSFGHYFDFFGGFRNVGLGCALIHSEADGLLCFYVRLLTVQHNIRQVSSAMPASLATLAAASPLIHSVWYDLWTMLNVTVCLSTDTVFRKSNI